MPLPITGRGAEIILSIVPLKVEVRSPEVDTYFYMTCQDAIGAKAMLELVSESTGIERFFPPCCLRSIGSAIETCSLTDMHQA